MRIGNTQPPLGTPLLRGHPLSKGLVACYLLNEGGGNKVIDSTYLNTLGTTPTALTYKQTARGNAGIFNGTTTKIDIGDMGSIEGVSAMSFSAWVNPSALVTNYAGFFGKQSSGVNNDLSFMCGGTGLASTSAVAFIMRNGGDTYGYTATGKLVVGTWTHVAGVFNGNISGNAGRLVIYVNGVLQTLTFVGTIPATTPSNAVNMEIGASGQTGTRSFFNGVINDLKIYNRALSATEVWQLFTNPYQMYQTSRPLKLAV